MTAGARVAYGRRESERDAASDWWRDALRLVPPGGQVPGVRRLLKRRLAAHWPHLVSVTWAPMLRHAAVAELQMWAAWLAWVELGEDAGARRVAQSRPPPKPLGLRWRNWRRTLPALVLELAFGWAEDRAVGQVGVPDAARSAVRRLGDLDAAIWRTTQSLRDLLRQREELQETTGVRSDWSAPGLSVWRAIDEAAAQFPDWAAVSKGERRRFIMVAQGQSRPGPDLADLLDAMLMSDVTIPTAVHAADAASIGLPSGSGHGSHAEWQRRFMADVASSFDYLDASEGEMRCLGWLTDRGMGCLLDVLAGYEPGSGPWGQGAAAKGNRRRFFEEIQAEMTSREQAPPMW